MIMTAIPVAISTLASSKIVLSLSFFSCTNFTNMSLNYAGGQAYSNAYFHTGSGPIFLDDVQCTSTSSQLLECPSRPILSHNCLNSADAGVGCEGV